MTVGQSEYTQTKEDHYASILGWQTGIAKRAIENQYRKWRETYLLIDATAGSGMLEGGIPGSPIRALQVLDARQFQYRAVFVEHDLTAFVDLQASIWQPAELRYTTYQQVLGEFCRYPDSLQLGMLYVDPNGTPDFDVLMMFAKAYPSMEILISVTANGVKRGGKTEASLAEWIRRIPKRYWLVRKPYSKWQWTFLFGTNYERGFNKPYLKIDLHPTTSEIGRQYLEQASSTKEELLKKVQPPITGLTLNTCDIQPTGQFAPSQSGERAVSVNDARRDL